MPSSRGVVVHLALFVALACHTRSIAVVDSTSKTKQVDSLADARAETIHRNTGATGTASAAEDASGGERRAHTLDIRYKQATKGNHHVGEVGGRQADHHQYYGDPLLTFTSTNEYDPVNWSPWTHLAEPWREATLTASTTLGDPEKDIFTWSIPDENGTILEGRCVDFARKVATMWLLSLGHIGLIVHSASQRRWSVFPIRS